TRSARVRMRRGDPTPAEPHALSCWDFRPYAIGTVSIGDRLRARHPGDPSRLGTRLLAPPRTGRGYHRAMTDQLSYVCRSCGQRHDGGPFAYGSEAPAYWSETLAADKDSALGEEQCIIQAEHYFVRARLVIPVNDAESDFEWGVWVTLSERNFERMSQLWTRA